MKKEKQLRTKTPLIENRKKSRWDKSHLVKIAGTNVSYYRKDSLVCKWPGDKADGFCHEQAAGIRKGLTASGAKVNTPVCEKHANKNTDPL